MKFLFTPLMACLFASSLCAKSITNQELLKICTDKGEGPQNFCYGFIIGAANAAQFYRNITDTTDQYIDICFPDTISNEDIVNIYVDWAKKNSSVANSSAFLGVSTSFSSKYSCKEKEEDKSKEK